MLRIGAFLGAALALAACGDPLRGVDRPEDVGPTGAVANVAAVPEDRAAPTLFQRLLGGADPVVQAAAAEAAAHESQPPAEPASAETAPPDPASEPENQVLLAGLAGANTAAAVPVAEGPETVTEVAVGRVGSGPDARRVAAGTVLPYGEIATICNLPRNQRGTRIKAASGVALYDPNPRSTALRPHYITGFDDGCARTFSGALVMFGDVGTHEVVRYQPSNRNLPFTGTDQAYETLKSRFCRAGHGQPCGARLEALGRNTTFITVYDRFGATPRWVEILVHDGEVLAIDFKGR